MTWLIEETENGGITIFECEPGEYSTFRETEIEAVEFAIECAEGRRESIAESIKYLKARRRALKRKAAKP